MSNRKTAPIMLIMTKIILLSIIPVTFPPLFLYLQKRKPSFGKINPIIISYLIGIILGNTGIMNEATRSSMDTIASVSAILAIPLMLYSLNLRNFGKLAGKAGLSMLLASLSVTVLSFTAHLLFRESIEESWKLAGLTIGVYTGGTPNLAAIRVALGVNMSSFLAVHTADMLWSALYLLFILSFGKKWIAKLLPGRNLPLQDSLHQEIHPEGKKWDRSVLSKAKMQPLLRNLGLALLVVAAGVGISALVPEDFSVLVTILVITTLSLGLSFLTPVRKTEFSFQLGEYFIYVFCIAAGALGDISELVKSAPQMILFVGFVLFGSFLLHILLCRITGVDGNTMMITSTSAICSPPFVPVVAVNLEASHLIIPGITTGLIGYALGNYLGSLAAHLFALI